MTKLRAFMLVAGITAAAAGATRAGAQDIAMQARRMGRPVPEWYKRQVAKNPRRYEFRHAWKSSLKKARAQRAAARASGGTASSAAAPGFHRPTGVVQGTFRVPVLPIVFAGTVAPYDYSTLQNKLFGVGSATSETVTRVYQEQSRGLLTLTGETYPWISVSGTNAYYSGTDNGGGPDAHLGALFQAVLDSADKTVDFAKYDQDHDGFVDFVAFVQPLAGGECGTSGIWSHRSQVDYELGAPYMTQDHDSTGRPIYISDYVIQPAMNCASFGGGPIDIGVFAHEFGHAFGLPDLYSTSYNNAGIGDWGLMSSGSYNTVDSPALMEGWSRVQLGWAPVVTIAHDTTITLAPLETNGPVLRLNIPGTDEYFFLENRQRIGSDADLYGTGLLIFHVDSGTVDGGWDTNNFQDVTNHKGLDVV
jgi:M6 family metalloprotease-like protein